MIEIEPVIELNDTQYLYEQTYSAMDTVLQINDRIATKNFVVQVTKTT